MPSHFGYALGLLLLGSLALGQGYQSPKDIDWENLEKVSWADAYRAVTTPGVREYLEELLKSGAEEHATAARALLYIMDGKSHREYLTAKFQELPGKLKQLEAAFPKSSVKGAKPEGLEYRVKALELGVPENALAAAALYHHGDAGVTEFVLRSIGRCPKRDAGSFHQQQARYVAGVIGEFGWQRVPQDDALKYLSSDDAELRMGAMVFLLGEPATTGPSAPAFYDPAKSAKANQQAIAEITAHFRKMHSELVARQQRRVDEIARKAQAVEQAAKAKADLGAVATAYDTASGEEQKRLALELDRVERVDYTKNFGHPYPGKPLDQQLAHRRLGIKLFVKKMLLNIKIYNLLPLAEREKSESKDLRNDSQQASLRAELGMPDEAKTVAEGWAFLAHVDAVLDGKEQALLHEKLAWEYCGISFQYNHAAQAKTVEEFEQWESHHGWNSAERFRLWPEEMAILIKRWAAYMARAYKIEDYIRSHVMVDICRERLRLEHEQKQRPADKDALYDKVGRLSVTNNRLLPAELDAIEKVARRHLEETGDFIAGKRPDSLAFGMPPPKSLLPPDPPSVRANYALCDCRAYVLRQAMVATKSFEDYFYYEELYIYRNSPPWEGRALAKERYPALVAEFAATYQRLLENHPELKPPPPPKW